MANPRKFSEKIALHTQKQAEETAAFEEIMREVMGATRLVSGTSHTHFSKPLSSSPPPPYLPLGSPDCEDKFFAFTYRHHCFTFFSI